MLPYSIIAETLEEISKVKSREDKIEKVSDLLKNIHPELLSPAVRLLLGQLWPTWKRLDRGIGPETLKEVLSDLYGLKIDAKSFDEEEHELGELTQLLIKQGSQSTLSPTPLSTLQVYQNLRQISTQKGTRSHHRKKALLKGLLLNASPTEAKYIARASLGKMMIGMGPHLMASAISRRFNLNEELVKAAYARLPDLGLVASTASIGEITEVKITPTIPVRPMLLSRAKDVEEAFQRADKVACHPSRGGLKMQVHKVDDQVIFYTNRLRNVTKAFQNMIDDFQGLKDDLIVEGEFVLMKNDKILPRSELLKYINQKAKRRKWSRHTIPSLIITDVLYANGEKLIQRDYAERQRYMRHSLKGYKENLLEGIKVSELEPLDSVQKGKKLCYKYVKQGFYGLIMRDLEAPYVPGVRNRKNSVVKLNDRQ